MSRFTMTKAMVAATSLGIFMLLVVGLFAARCRRPAPVAPVVVIDTVAIDSATHAPRKPRAKKPRKSSGTTKRTKSPTPPTSRNYLDEPATAHQDSI